MQRFKILLRHGIKSFKDSLSLNIASIFTIITVLFIYNTFVIMAGSSETFLTKMSGVESIRAYSKVTDEKTVEEVTKKIQEIKGVAKVQYLDAEASFKYLKEAAESITYIDKVPKELFPAFFEITLKSDFSDMDSAKLVTEKLQDIPQIETTGFGEKWIENFIKIRSGIRMFVIILTVLLTISVTFIIYNTIKLNLFRFKDDIKIYSLVGATSAFITTPYIISSFIEITISFVISAFSVHYLLMGMNIKLLEPVGLNLIILPDIFFYLKSFAFISIVSMLASYYSVQSFLGKVGSINEG